MEPTPIREVLAANLRYYMQRKGLTQMSLSNLSGVAQTTIGLYLSPERRKMSKSGKLAAPNLGQVEQLAGGLGVHIWELLRPMSPTEREAYEQIEAAFLALRKVNADGRAAVRDQATEVS